MNRKIGINIDRGTVWGHGELMREVAAVGFDGVFTSSDPEFVAATAEYCRKYGLDYTSLHAPFRGINAMWENGEQAQDMLAQLCASADLAAEYGVPVIVAHLSSGDDAPHVTDAGLENFTRLVDHAREKGITVAFENQRKLGNIAVIFELFENDPSVGFCWDVGHEKCFAYGREYMPLFGKRCIYTHIHDNHQAHGGDEHLLPFEGTIDYKNTARRIVQAGYEGPLTLEIAEPSTPGERYADLTARQFAEKAYAAVDQIRNLCEEAETE